jgi:hypothetical protein
MENLHPIGDERPDYLPTEQERLRPEESEIEPGIKGADDAAFSRVLGESVEVMVREAIPYALIGGIASSGYGRPRWTHDIDILVKPEDAERTLEAFKRQGFATEKTDLRWLYKAFKWRVMVDIIFRSTGGIHLDSDMVMRATEGEFLGHRVRFAAPEDLLVMKAVVHDENGPRHWHDALGLIAGTPLDWDYLLRRARRAPRRVLSLLVYAHSLDLHVPNKVIRELFEQLYGE